LRKDIDDEPKINTAEGLAREEGARKKPKLLLDDSKNRTGAPALKVAEKQQSPCMEKTVEPQRAYPDCRRKGGLKTPRGRTGVEGRTSLS